MMGWEKVLCELKDHRQHGLLKQRHSITSANTKPTSVMNSRVVLLVRLICHDEKVCEEVIFCKTSQYKSQLHFPSHNNRTCTELTYKQLSPLLPRS